MGILISMHKQGMVIKGFKPHSVFHILLVYDESKSNPILLSFWAIKFLTLFSVTKPLEFTCLYLHFVTHCPLLMQVEGKTVLKFALCYGFRNLQNVVRKIKTGKCDYHFLEIMACPSGINILFLFPFKTKFFLVKTSFRLNSAVYIQLGFS